MKQRRHVAADQHDLRRGTEPNDAASRAVRLQQSVAMDGAIPVENIEIRTA